jgi:NAD(P)-dependent dehydrogenase (short-subunit alcohol dehydrogenase family)
MPKKPDSEPAPLPMPRTSLAGKRIIYAADADERGGSMVVEALLAAGATVLAVSRSEPFLGHLMEHLGRPRAADGLTVVRADVSDYKDAFRVATMATAHGSAVNAVIANLGCSHRGPATQDAAAGDWEALGHGLRAHMVLAKALMPVLRKVPDSLYLLLNDGAALDPRPASGITAVAAAGELMFARTLAQETGGSPIVHSLVVMASAAGVPSCDDWLTPDNIGEAVVRLVEAPRAGYGQVVLNGATSVAASSGVPQLQNVTLLAKRKAAPPSARRRPAELPLTSGGFAVGTVPALEHPPKELVAFIRSKGAERLCSLDPVWWCR